MSSIPTISYHPEFTQMQDELKNVRTAILGSPFVKAEREALLPHPSSIDTTSKDAQMRYDAYLAGAEYDEFPKQTLKTLLGRMNFQSTAIELPERLSYLVENSSCLAGFLRSVLEIHHIQRQPNRHHSASARLCLSCRCLTDAAAMIRAQP